MGSPAVVLGDVINATCSTHQIPNPASGVPQPGPPFPFMAKITLQCEPTVLIGGKPAAVAGSSGLNLPPHVGLHPADPFMAPPMQKATIVDGSPTVLIGGKPAARQSSNTTVCFGMPGTIVPSVMTVQIA